MTRLLVTGASGLLGSNLVEAASRSLDVTAVVHRNRLLFGGAEVVQTDLTDREAIFSLVLDTNPDWIIHCAADTGIDEIESDPDRAFSVNVRMSADLAEAAAQIEARLLYVSTDSVFDGLNGPYNEYDDPHPINEYARSKLEGERAVLRAHHDVLVVRTNMFGWSPGQKTSLAEWFYSRLARGEHCPGFTDIYFSPVYVQELARIFIEMLGSKLHGLYHVPGADCINKYSFGLHLAQSFGFEQGLIVPTDSERMQWKASRPKRTCLDGAKFVRDSGTKLPSLHDGLTQFCADKEKFGWAVKTDSSSGGI